MNPVFNAPPSKPDGEAEAIVDIDKIPSAVLRRLVKEVRDEKLNPTMVYNRTHNRHNRGGG